MNQSIRDIMTADPVTLKKSASVQEAATAMREADIGDVIVLDDSDQLCGLVTDRDIAIRLVAEGKDASRTQLGEICSKSVETLSPDASIADAVKTMSEKAVRRIPVVEQGRPIGIVALGDLAVSRDPDSALADISEAPPNN